MIATLADHEEVAGDNSSDSTPAIWPELHNCHVICVPGPGPLDAAVAMMATQLLRRVGCKVSEQSRDQLRHFAGTPGPGEVEIICLLGLFDQRGSARMKRIAASIEEGFVSVGVVIGVQRAMERASVANQAEHALPFSLSDLVALVQAARPNQSSSSIDSL